MDKIDELEAAIMVDEAILLNMQELGNIDYDKYIKLASSIAKSKEKLADLYENTNNF